MKEAMLYDLTIQPYCNGIFQWKVSTLLNKRNVKNAYMKHQTIVFTAINILVSKF